jgi:signal transduction histidine kinase
MDAGRPAVRLFLLFLAVALPPLVAFAALSELAPTWLSRVGTGTALLIVALFAAVWAAVVGIVSSRLFRGDLQAILDLAERGPTAGESEPSAAYQRLAAALDERNRQIADLATRVRAAPIEQDAGAVARSTVAAARSVTRDPIWTLVIVRTPDAAALAIGTYGGAETEPTEITDTHLWASTIDPDDEAVPGVRYAIGPWGAFTVVEVAAGEELRANLLAPWEGRSAPNRAEREVLSLLGQTAATAIEHALLYARLRAQAEELDRLATLQTDFLRGVTHDLQTPLTSIRALAAELREQPGLSEAGRRDLETITHQADRLRRMVGQLLVVSRLEAGALTPEVEVFRPEPIVRRTWEALRAGRSLNLDVARTPYLVVADPDRFEQVLWALLDNAVKYSPDGSPITVNIGVSELGNGDLSAEIRITDEGAGMDEETRRRAFEQFYRSGHARRLAPDGSGVGLYAARGLIEMMSGSIEIDSQLGAGTTVTLRLPAEGSEDLAQ